MVSVLSQKKALLHPFLQLPVMMPNIICFLSSRGSWPGLLWGYLEIFNNKELWLWAILPTKIGTGITYLGSHPFRVWSIFARVETYYCLNIIQQTQTFPELIWGPHCTPLKKSLYQGLKGTWLQRKDYETFWEEPVSIGSILCELHGLREVRQILQGSVSKSSVCYNGDEPKVIMYSNGTGFSTSLDCMGGFSNHRLSDDLQGTQCAAFTTCIWSWAYVHVSKIDFK